MADERPQRVGQNVDHLVATFGIAGPRSRAFDSCPGPGRRLFFRGIAGCWVLSHAAPISQRIGFGELLFFRMNRFGKDSGLELAGKPDDSADYVDLVGSPLVGVIAVVVGNHLHRRRVAVGDVLEPLGDQPKTVIENENPGRARSRGPRC